MSPYRRERIFASIELDRVALVKLPAGGAVARSKDHLIDLAFDTDRPERSLRDVSKLLSQPGWSGTARHVVLSDRFVRYVVIERPHGTRSLAELELAIGVCFEEAFDASSAQWDIVTDARPFAQYFFACAVPRRMLEAVRSAFCDHGECASIRPYLVCELNRRARRMPDAHWFVTGAHDCVGLVGMESGELRHVRVFPSVSPTSSTIAELVERERLLSGVAAEGRKCLFSGVLEGADDDAILTRLDHPRWATPQRTWSSNYRVALSEVWP